MSSSLPRISTTLFDICPGFWKAVLHHHEKGRVFTIDRVRRELLSTGKTDPLVKWITRAVPTGFFLPADTAPVVRAYETIMQWIQIHPQYFDYAKTKFAAGADPWLAAYASVHKLTLVTNEQSAPASRRTIKLPDVCNRFSIRHASLFAMLRERNTRFDSVVGRGAPLGPGI